MAAGNKLLKCANTFESKKAPIEEQTQPIKLIPPKLASVAGIIKTPAPIILPTTKEVLVHKPNFLSAACITKYTY